MPGGAAEPRAKQLFSPNHQLDFASGTSASALARPADHAALSLASKNMQATSSALEVIASAYNHGVLQYFGFLGVASPSPTRIEPTITALTDPVSDR
jgi:hypothetical protein